MPSFTPSDRRLIVFLAFWSMVFVVLASTDATLQGQSNGMAERYRAFAVDMSDPAYARTGFVEIVVNRWPTKAEQEKTLRALDDGQDAFVKALQKNRRIGYIQTPDSIGWDLHYVQVVKGEDGGRTITLMTERPIGFWESVNRPRSIDFPLMWIELRLDKEGRGEGTMFLAAKASGSLKHRFLVMENFAMQSVRLNDVRTIRPPT
jgi:hypothetical protein